MAEITNDYLSKHPEVLQSAARLFNLSADRRILQEVVPRGDVKEVTFKPYDITSEDINGLAIYATSIIDKRLLQQNRSAAIHDACLMAVRDKDNGKYDGRVSANTQGLIMKAMEPLVKGGSEEKNMSKEAKSEKKEESKKEEPKGNPNSLVTKKFLPSGKEVTNSPAQQKKQIQESGLPQSVKVKLRKEVKASIVEKLDSIAGRLQEAGEIKLATDLDIIANTLEQEDGQD